MGLFSSITKIFKPVTKILPKAITKPITQVVRAADAIVAKPSNLLAVASKGPVLGPIEFFTGAVAPKAAPIVSLASSLATSFVPGGQAKMALNLGGILNRVSGIFGGNQNPVFNTISNVAGLASQFVPQNTVTSLAVRPPMPMPVPRGPMAAAGGMVARSFFNRFPNLAVAIQQLRDRGMRVKRSQLWSMLKRFGPEVLITGGLLTAAAVNELMVAGPGRRRMNPANVHALRRSMRRLESFHKLCVTADRLRAPRRRACKTGSRNAQQFVRQG